MPSSAVIPAVVQRAAANACSGTPAFISDWSVLREVTWVLLEQLVHRPADAVGTSSSFVQQHRSRVRQLRHALHTISVPRLLSDFANGPHARTLHRRIAGDVTVDDAEFDQWAERFHPRNELMGGAGTEASERLPFPVFVELLQGLARYHHGVPTGVGSLPRVAPHYGIVGPPPGGAAAVAGLAHFLKDGGRDIAVAHARSRRTPVPLATARQSVKSCVVGAVDAGLLAGVLAQMQFNATLVTDARRLSLGCVEDTLQQLVETKRVAKASLRFRVAQAEGFPAFLGNDDEKGPEAYASHFDFAVCAAPVLPLLATPWMAPEHHHRLGATTVTDCIRAFDADAPRRLRPTGGHVAVLMNNFDSLGAIGGTTSTGGADLTSAPLLRTITSIAGEPVFSRTTPQPNALVAELAYDDQLSRAREGFLGHTSRTFDDPFSKLASTPPAVCDALQAAVEQSAAQHVAVYYLPEAGLAHHVFGSASYRHPALPDAMLAEPADSPVHAVPRMGDTHHNVLEGDGPWAEQGLVTWQDTYEYDHYLPKAGPTNKRHRAELMACGEFDFLEPATPDTVVGQRREAAERARQRRAAGVPAQQPRDSEGEVLLPTGTRAHTMTGGVNPNLNVLTKKIHKAGPVRRAAREAQFRARQRDALDKGSSQPSSASSSVGGPPEPVPLLEQVFSSGRRRQRSDALRRKLTASNAATEVYMEKVRQGADAKLERLNELHRWLDTTGQRS